MYYCNTRPITTEKNHLHPRPPHLSRYIVPCGTKCFCGTAEEFDSSVVASEQCGVSYEVLCAGDPTMACGGRNAISVYERRAYSLVGCYQDDRDFRLMGPKGSAPVMSAAVRWCGLVLLKRGATPISFTSGVVALYLVYERTCNHVLGAA